MNSLYDLLLDRPIQETWINLLMFLVFALHFFFVLLTLGTAILAFYLFLESLITGQIRDLRWDKYILRTFLAHKSLAVVLGVGALLLIQVGFTIPFFTGITLFAPRWMLIIPLLIVSFLSFDSLAHKIRVHHITHLIFGFVALVSLLIVPAIFVTILVTAENPSQWTDIANDSYQLSGLLSIHWLFRYLHVLGAGVVFGGAFHYFFGDHEDWKRRKLLRLIVGGVLFQIVVGVMLYGYLPRRPEALINAVLVTGIISAMVLLWIVIRRVQQNKLFRWGEMLTVLLFILIPMLLTRQLLQYQAFEPLNQKLNTAASMYAEKIEPYRDQALDTYSNTLNTVYDNGETIFNQSCAFCHGINGNGMGNEAGNLSIMPEAISFIHTTRSHLFNVLKNGVPGTGMPYFSYYDKNKLDNLLDHLNKKFKILAEPKSDGHQVSSADRRAADSVYKQTCSVCHGPDGKGTKFSNEFQPSPPDFTSYTLTGEYAYRIISTGYRGTMMQAYTDLPEAVKWGLIDKIKEMYHLKGEQ